MKKLIVFIVMMVALQAPARSQPALPITLMNAPDTTRAVIFYISGDGGWNKFSSSLAQSLSQLGYTVAGLDARTYFWEKKAPAAVASALSIYVEHWLAGRPMSKIIFLGYSFGADVLPFIVNALPEATKSRIRSVVLVSPSVSTDFEIHWSDMFGWNKRRGNDVAAAINLLRVPKVFSLFGQQDDEDLPVNTIHLSNFSSKVLPGGHHFDGRSSDLARAIIAGS